MKKYICFLFILFTTVIFSNNINISGSLKNKDINLGGVKLEFVNSENQIFTTETDILGNFNISLEKRKYRIKIGSYGYFLEKQQDILYDFSKEGTPNYLKLFAIKQNSFISGKILDNNSLPLPNAFIKIKHGMNTINLTTNPYGEFYAELPSGIFILTGSYPGFKNNTVIKELPKASSIENLFLTLEPLYFKLSGVISNGIEALKGIKLSLYTYQGELITTVVSSENGYYEFNDLQGENSFFIVVEDEQYTPYKSQIFSLKENLENNYIIIKEKK